MTIVLGKPLGTLFATKVLERVLSFYLKMIIKIEFSLFATFSLRSCYPTVGSVTGQSRIFIIKP